MITLTPIETAALSHLATLSEPYRPLRGAAPSATCLARLVPHGLVTGQREPIDAVRCRRREVTVYSITVAGLAAVEAVAA